MRRRGADCLVGFGFGVWGGELVCGYSMTFFLLWGVRALCVCGGWNGIGPLLSLTTDRHSRSKSVLFVGGCLPTYLEAHGGRLVPVPVHDAEETRGEADGKQLGAHPLPGVVCC